VSNQYFGDRPDAPRWDGGVRVPVPVGELCVFCGEPILAGDRGVVTPAYVEDGAGGCAWVIRAGHLECDLRGMMSHMFWQCRCFVRHPSLRAEARATLAAINARRAEQGMGPM
jgi:hypothetical protein